MNAEKRLRIAVSFFLHIMAKTFEWCLSAYENE